MPDETNLFNLFNRFSQRAGFAVMVARLVAGRAGASVIDTEDLLTGLIYVDGDLIAGCGASRNISDVPTCVQRWRTVQAEPIPQSQDMPISETVETVFAKSKQFADEMSFREIRTEHLLLSLMSTPGCHGALALFERGGDLEKIVSLARTAYAEPQTVSESVKLSIGELFN